MILKFKEISNMAVFKSFQWDDIVLDQNGRSIVFKQVNILYGRNYSGKTTLSRIIRAYETGVLSDKYKHPTFRLVLDDGNELTEADYPQKPLIARVFNEDFVRDNLQFAVNPDSDILPFAILGEDNAKIEAEITELKKILGANDGTKSTGLYKQMLIDRDALIKANESSQAAKTALEKQKTAKATGRGTGIKYQFNRFGQQNYNIRDLNKDIEYVCSDSYVVPPETELAMYEESITEQKKSDAREIKAPNLRLQDLIKDCKELCGRKIGTSEKNTGISKKCCSRGLG